MKRTSVQRPALVEPVTVVVALVNVLSSTGASQEGLSAGCPGPPVGAAATAGRLSAACAGRRTTAIHGRGSMRT